MTRPPSVTPLGCDEGAPAGTGTDGYGRDGAAVEVLREGTPSGVCLVCLPFAGGSARSFEPLARCVPASWWIGVPSRPRALDPAPVIDKLAQDAASTVMAAASSPTLLLGHSMGAVVAHRAAQMLGKRWPARAALVLSAPPSLDRAAEDAAALAASPPERLLGEVRRLGLVDGRYSDDVLMRLVLPTFRRDLFTLASHRHSSAPLGTRPVVLTGTRDPQAPPDACRHRAANLDARRVHEIPGNHPFVMSRPAEVAALLEDLASLGAEPAAPTPALTTRRK